ncbi:hypothetical protein GXW82_43950 [Streptacidiphilus sp. 4-A2]|nr:hypothetical protein [Streptacidiphilus sp. 4-A2]
MAGGEAIFDQGLSNGLAAIVAHEWPGEEANAKGRVLSASGLLSVIEKHVTADSNSVLVIPDPDAGSRAQHTDTDSIFQRMGLPDLDTRIDVRALLDGLAASQPVRHGSGTGGLRRRHVDALLALDDHTSLRAVGEQHAERIWETSLEEDRHSAARAVALLALIGDDEAERLAKAVDNPNAYHPKHNPDGHDLDTCPVCGYETFCVQGHDTWGRVGVGQCLVCHYIRDSVTADSEGFSEHLAWIDGKN